MGMLGAMAGFGKGLTDYSKTMEEKKKMDWQAQQETVKHERTMNLQKIADRRASERQDVLIGAKAKEGVLQREATTADIGVRAEAQVGAARDIATEAQKMEHKVAEEKWAEVSASEEYAKAPEGLKTLIGLQFKVSGDVDISKLLSAGNGSSKNGKAPTAKHLEFVMGHMSQEPAFANLPPAATLALAAKLGTQIANGEEISYEGKVLPPNKYAEVAKEFANGDRDWGTIKNLNLESIKGIMIEYEKIHPSTSLGGKAAVTKITPRAKGTTDIEYTGAETFGGTPQGSPVSRMLGGSLTEELDVLRNK